jgi:hypothetical protein
MVASCGVPFSHELLLNLLYQQSTPTLTLLTSSTE